MKEEEVNSFFKADIFSRNKRQVAIICEKCETVFPITFEEFWHWDYDFGNYLFDENKNPIVDKNGEWIQSKCGWELKKGKGGYPHHAHTPYGFCPECKHCNDLNLTKKAYRHLRRPSPTEMEYQDEKMKKGWE